MLRNYTSKQVNVLACLIEETGTVTKIEDGEYKYEHKGRGAITTVLIFAVSNKQNPQAGDYIIQLSKEDIYLCPADVFKEKYVVTGMVIK
jgi:hypothetical protein